jgi:hypothetical protein
VPEFALQGWLDGEVKYVQHLLHRQDRVREDLRAQSGDCGVIDGRFTPSPVCVMESLGLMPATWSQWQAPLNLGNAPYNPRDDILAGAANLREHRRRYGSPGFLAAYYAGSFRYDEFLATGRPPPNSTTDYVARIQRIDAAVSNLAATGSFPRMQKERSLFVGAARSGSHFDARDRDTGEALLLAALTHADRHGERNQAAHCNVQDEDAK